MSPLVDVLVGTVGRARGLRGQVQVAAHTDSPESRFAPGARVVAEGRRLTVVSAHEESGRLLLTFAEVPTRAAAEALRGMQLWAEVAEDARPDEEGEFYDRHLIGLEVRRQGSQEAVGAVTDVRHLPAQDCLVVTVDGQERLVPFVTELVPVVDLDAGYLEVSDLPGLLTDEAEEG